MSDLEHFFRQLVANLAATDPHRLHQQLQVAEIQRDILPYRAHRRALALESAEDYEVLLLRLCAGEGGFARLDPPELQARLQSELASPNPDLTLLRAHGDALVWLNASGVAGALAADPHAAYAPPTIGPGRAPEETLGPALENTEPDLPAADDNELPLDEVAAARHAPDPHGADSMCLYCGGALPAGRLVNFCPHCGQSQRTLRCASCQAEVEYGWRHCVNCGGPIGDG